jgi:hypothetical protein
MIKQVGIVLAVIVAYGAREMLRHHWMFITPQRADFQKPVQFKEKAVPVIYYEPGKLGEKLTAVRFTLMVLESVYAHFVFLFFSGRTASSCIASRRVSITRSIRSLCPTVRLWVTACLAKICCAPSLRSASGASTMSAQR